MRLQVKSLPASLVILLAASAWPARVVTTIENDRYKVDIEASDGTFTVAFKPGGKTFVTAGRLRGTGATTHTVELHDEDFGKGQGVEVTYAGGSRELVALYAKLPFVTFRSTLRNSDAEPVVHKHVQTVSAALDVGVPPAAINTLGTGGLLAPDKNPGSYAFLSIVDPRTRSGVVGGWLTHDRGSGVVFSPVADGTVRMQAQIDYGCLRIGPGGSHREPRPGAGHLVHAVRGQLQGSALQGSPAPVREGRHGQAL